MKFIDVLQATNDDEIIVLISGGRTYGEGLNSAVDRKRLGRVLGTILHMCTTNDKLLRIVHGGAKGADTLAGTWAGLHNVPCTVYKADWLTYKKAAGPIRNAEMLNDSKPHFAVVFPGGEGTAHMTSLLNKASVPLYKVEFDIATN